jgi:hypothetical protein
MADDEVDHDLLEFMRAHMNGNGQKSASDCNLGVLESAERICNVSHPLRTQKLTHRMPWTYQ